MINGRIIGRVRGLKVRLTATAQVKGDIIHKTIAIESGAHFEGSVTRQDDPLSTGGSSGSGAGAGAGASNGGTSNGGGGGNPPKLAVVLVLVLAMVRPRVSD